MQLPWDEHFQEIVIPAWQAYRSAETQLSEAHRVGDEAVIRLARYTALREGGAASFYLHHFAEIILRAEPAWLPADARDLRGLRQWLAQSCTMLRSASLTNDVALLNDIVDALKHAILTNQQRDVPANEAVLVVTSGYGVLRYGEGKFGGGEQVVVNARSGPRALSSILQNVVDAWRRAANLELPPIGRP